MTTLEARDAGAVDLDRHVDTINRDAITALRGAFSREWVEQMREDMMTAFWAAISVPAGPSAAGRAAGTWRSIPRPSRASLTWPRIPG